MLNRIHRKANKILQSILFNRPKLLIFVLYRYIVFIISWDSTQNKYKMMISWFQTRTKISNTFKSTNKPINKTES